MPTRLFYCHCDGYESHNGRILLHHYRDPDKVRALLDLGDISSLAEEIGEKHDFSNRPDGQVTAYGRDRGENDTQARVFSTVEAWLASMEEYAYLHVGGDEWHYSDHGQPLKRLKPAHCK